MQNKSAPKSWADIQMIISSIAIAVTLGLWSLFSAPQKKNAGAVAAATIVPTRTASPTVVVQPQLAPGQKLLFGGTAPQQKVVVINGGGGSGGGGGAVATTRSS